MTERLRRIAVHRVHGMAAASWLTLYGVLALGVYILIRHGTEFYPDSRYYMAMALRDGGTDLPHAVLKTGQVYPTRFDTWYFSSNDVVWKLVQPRILVPLLSAPFVKVLGVSAGMLVVPVASLAYFTFGMATVARRMFGEVVAVVAVGGFLLSSLLYTWAGAALTEGLTLALLTMIVVNLPLGREDAPVRAHNVVLVGFAICLIAMTRQIGPVPAGMIGAPWLWEWVRTRRFRNTWFPFAAVAVVLTGVTQLVLSLVAPFDLTSQFVAQSGYPTLHAALRHLPQIVWRMITAEYGYMLADRVMLAFVLIATVYGVVRWRRTTSALLIGAVIPTFVLTVGNGIPSQMRYEITLYPAVVLAVAATLAALLRHVAPLAAHVGVAASAPGDGAPTADALAASATASEPAAAPAALVGAAGSAPVAASAAPPSEGPSPSEGLSPSDGAPADDEPAGEGPAGGVPPSRWRWRTPAARDGDGASGRDRRLLPLVAGCVAFLIFAVAWSASFGSASAAPQAPGPSSAAALGGSADALPVVAATPAETTLREAFTAMTGKARHSGDERWYLLAEVRHDFRYTPSGPADPGWSGRAADGTTVVTPGDLSDADIYRFLNAVTRDGTVVPASVVVVRRSTSPYGQDVAFTATDTAGRLHAGQAVTLYATQNAPFGTLTTLTWQS